MVRSGGDAAAAAAPTEIVKNMRGFAADPGSLKVATDQGLQVGQWIAGVRAPDIPQELNYPVVPSSQFLPQGAGGSNLGPGRLFQLAYRVCAHVTLPVVRDAGEEIRSHANGRPSASMCGVATRSGGSALLAPTSGLGGPPADGGTVNRTASEVLQGFRPVRGRVQGPKLGQLATEFIQGRLAVPHALTKSPDPLLAVLHVAHIPSLRDLRALRKATAWRMIWTHTTTATRRMTCIIA